MPDTTYDGNTIIPGQLEIDHAKGEIHFYDHLGNTVLRVTHLRKPTPRGVGVDLVSVAQLTSFTPLPDYATAPDPDAEPIDASGTERCAAGGPPADRVLDTHCPTCGQEHRLHKRVNIPQAGMYMYPGHEYELVTKLLTGHGYPRGWRMGFQGPGQDRNHLMFLMFSGRGPDRSHSGEYAGDVSIVISSIIEAHEVAVDHAKRYTNRTRRDLEKI